MRKLPILAMSGSLRAASGNTAMLEAVREFAPSGAEVTIFRGLGDLPRGSDGGKTVAGKRRGMARIDELEDSGSTGMGQRRSPNILVRRRE
jgi:hypothetical protein